MRTRTPLPHHTFLTILHQNHTPCKIMHITTVLPHSSCFPGPRTGEGPTWDNLGISAMEGLSGRQLHTYVFQWGRNADKISKKKAGRGEGGRATYTEKYVPPWHDVGGSVRLKIPPYFEFWKIFLILPALVYRFEKRKTKRSHSHSPSTSTPQPLSLTATSHSYKPSRA